MLNTLGCFLKQLCLSLWLKALVFYSTKSFYLEFALLPCSINPWSMPLTNDIQLSFFLNKWIIFFNNVFVSWRQVFLLNFIIKSRHLIFNSCNSFYNGSFFKINKMIQRVSKFFLKKTSTRSFHKRCATSASNHMAINNIIIYIQQTIFLK